MTWSCPPATTPNARRPGPLARASACLLLSGRPLALGEVAVEVLEELVHVEYVVGV